MTQRTYSFVSLLMIKKVKVPSEVGHCTWNYLIGLKKGKGSPLSSTLHDISHNNNNTTKQALATGHCASSYYNETGHVPASPVTHRAAAKRVQQEQEHSARGATT
jgi:hypothetical protein